jgi:hypothetical protein
VLGRYGCAPSHVHRARLTCALNPQAPNWAGFSVFTPTYNPKLSFAHGVALVAISVVLVGLIAWTGERTPGQPVARGLTFLAIDLDTPMST